MSSRRGLASKRAGDGHALALAAGEAVRAAVEQGRDAEQVDSVIERDPALGAAGSALRRSPGCARTARCGNRLASWKT